MPEPWIRIELAPHAADGAALRLIHNYLSMSATDWAGVLRRDDQAAKALAGGELVARQETEAETAARLAWFARLPELP